MAKVETPGWDPTNLAVHREDLLGEDDQLSLALLRHPSYPFRADISEDPAQLFVELCEVADYYVGRVGLLDPLLSNAHAIASTPGALGFGWLAIGWDGPDGLVDPRGSFAVRRMGATAIEVLDCTVVLVAGNRRTVDRRTDSQGAETADGLSVGLRVVMHISRSRASGRLRVRVTGLSASELQRARPRENPSSPATETLLANGPSLGILVNFIANALDFSAGSVSLHGVEAIDQTTVRLAGVGARAVSSTESRGYQWCLDANLADAGSAAPLSGTSNRRSVEQLSEGLSEFAEAPGSGAEFAHLFLRDAASAGFLDSLVERRPTREYPKLDCWRKLATLPALLRDDRFDARFEVLKSVVADSKNCNPDEVQRVDPASLALRSDHLAAAHAFRRATEFFELLEGFGLRSNVHFKFAKFPLRMRHRAWFDSRPSGNAINAQVRVDDPPLGFLGAYDPAKRPRLEVCFGAADLSSRESHTDDHGRLTSQPLGLAADPRWAWHEFGHVLCFASTGALEFQFAHSVGDALAAVLSDPASELARSATDALRGVTFPWVQTGRRHDRRPEAGWCWCGVRNGMRHAPLKFPPLLYKGYTEEQLLSTSIFNLYRAIGGDTFNNRATRHRAAHTCAYLVMRAVALLGPAFYVPARSADAFVSALVDADIGTSAVRGHLDHHVGGCLHKVIRWAFERQGLFATTDPRANVEGPGRPTAVDLWIKDRRSEDGQYTPAPLNWSDSDPQAWHANPEDVTVTASGDLFVTVRNRGHLPATSVTIQGWAAKASKKGLRWHSLGRMVVGGIDGGGQVRVKIARVGWPLKQHHILVEATCAEDRSNLDDSAFLPISTGAPPLHPEQVLDLVANDNNLALVLVSTKAC